MFVVKRILGQVRKAIQDFDMIQDGDRIAVGVSGGKDSLTLLLALANLKKFYPVNFDLQAVTLTMGMYDIDLAPVKKLCEELDVKYTVEGTLIGRIVFEEKQEKNPCSLCANLRRGALNSTAVRLGCNKVALAHNRDDVIETLLMSTFYEGRLHTFAPVTWLERKQIHIIRPLIYVEEKEIKAFIREKGLTIIHNPCEANGKTKRQYIKDLLHTMSKDHKKVKSTIFGAIRRSGRDGWHL